MLYLKYLLSAACFALLAFVAGAIVYDIYMALALDRLLHRRDGPAENQRESAALRPVKAVSGVPGAAQAEFETLEIPVRTGEPRSRAGNDAGKTLAGASFGSARNEAPSGNGSSCF
jgi:hypothetical protein